MMDPFFAACLEANREICRYIEEGLSIDDHAKGKTGAGGDRSSGIDLAAEKIFVNHLSRFGQIESEESGIIGKGDHKIIIDPIDGSSNILSSFPYYGTSVALIDASGQTVEAVVCNLASKEIYFKKKGQKPQSCDLFGSAFTVMHAKSDAEIGIFERAYKHADIVKDIEKTHIKFRSPGAVALSLVYARFARFFLYIGRYRSYDFAAGLLFCEDLEVDINDQYVIVTQDNATLEAIQTIATKIRSK